MAEGGGERPAGPPLGATPVVHRAALLAGLCPFIPLPFLDRRLVTSVRAYMVASLLRAHGRELPPAYLSPLWEDESGCLGRAFLLPLRLVVVPIQKVFRSVFFFLALREAAFRLGEALLLGRSIDRRLAAGAFADRAGDPTEEAQRHRDAFELAFRDGDLRLMRQLLEGVYRSVEGLPGAGARAVRAMFDGEGAAEEPRPMPEEEGALVEEGVAMLEQAQVRQDLSAYLEEFDARFEARLEELRLRDAPGSS